MKYIPYYRENNVQESETFTFFLENLKPSIKVWDYFVNWEKVNGNMVDIKVELNILNSLIGSRNLENDFINLVRKYPNTIKVLPIILAVRENSLQIIKDYQNNDMSYLEFDFSQKASLDYSSAAKYFNFIEQSGLIDLFSGEKIKNFVDYTFGVEVGLDSNGRKNRGGKLMENILEVFILDFVQKNKNLDYLSEATPQKIMQKWGKKIKYEKSSRKFDFAIYNKKTGNIIIIESNFYNGGGSKLKSVCGEFRQLFDELQKQNIELIWITDGKGWLTTKRPLEESFNHNNYIFNLKMISEGILGNII
ncbi:type II restriction endonuclease [Methanogenium organophilum]|uniref:Type-2 restriction enzyme n=1 Tax=Methanogenium organophilum TaxID=2199 RepID=A0A9X9S3Y9_METOG|nr:type II restriction endonuclease [Methanogenium organophilum]WAI01353.1 type II restriction endonuclease [Methanogenium organophilum]